MFFMDKRSSFAEKEAAVIEERLDHAASHFNMSHVTRELKEKIAADAHDDLTKLANEAFLVVTSTGDRRYPLRNAGEVKAAADWLSQYRDEFDFDTRHAMATKILQKAAEFGSAIGEHADMLNKTAGNGFCSGETVHDFLVKRAMYTRRRYPEYAEQLEKVAAAVKENKAHTRERETLLKLAQQVDEFDRQTKLVPMYAQGLKRAEEVFFELNEKLANDLIDEHLSSPTGNIYEKSALGTLKLNDVRGWMGTDFADAVNAGGLFVDAEKVANIVPTLPRDDAQMFDKMCSALGLAITAKEAAHYGPLLDDNELNKFAALYEG
jgi:hypothetical protein